MSIVSQILADPRIYALWQTPFARRKIVPFLQDVDLQAVRDVLDIGCGPGTNASLFTHSRYVGVDTNPRYIEFARSRYRGEFVAADALAYVPPPGRKFDLILLNSFLHHVDDDAVRALLANVERFLAADGFVHLLDLVLPERPCLARTMAAWDHGEHARPLREWQRIFAERFDAVAFHPYPLGIFRLTLWQMVHIKGKKRG